MIAVPARDEADHLPATLERVLRAVTRARDQGLVERAAVVVAAHRCDDATAAVARVALHREPCSAVLQDEISTTVGQVRDRALRHGLGLLDEPASCRTSTWLLSTDADTSVGPDWVVGLLTEAASTEAVSVVGTVALDQWLGTPASAAAYARTLAAKMITGSPTHQHDHVYGANLAVRLDAYLDVGGFPHVGHGEDQQLVDRLAAAGHRVLRTRAVEVTTSGRHVGRAAGGLADHLRGLEAGPQPTTT